MDNYFFANAPPDEPSAQVYEDANTSMRGGASLIKDEPTSSGDEAEQLYAIPDRRLQPSENPTDFNHYAGSIDPVLNRPWFNAADTNAHTAHITTTTPFGRAMFTPSTISVPVYNQTGSSHTSYYTQPQHAQIGQGIASSFTGAGQSITQPFQSSLFTTSGSRFGNLSIPASPCNHQTGASITQSKRPCTPGPRTPELDDGTPARRQSAFWAQENFLQKADGQVAFAPNMALWYQHPDAHSRMQIWREYEDFCRNLAIMGIDDALDQTSKQSAVGAEHENDHVKRKKLGGRRVSKVKAEMPRPVAHASLPPYIPDPSLQSEEACRAFVAYPDPEDTQHVLIAHDDWQTVKAYRIDEFTGQIYLALVNPYAEHLPPRANFREDNMPKYREQQIRATAELANLLKTPTQIKAAQAQCRLLVYVAIHVSEFGVSKKTYDGYRKFVDDEKVVQRDYHLDLDSTCSQRLAKVVRAVKANKLIAKDVVSGTNFNRFVQDPDYYVLDKLKYLSSNAVRDAKIKESKDAVGVGSVQKKVAKGRGRKVKTEQHQDADACLTNALRDEGFGVGSGDVEDVDGAARAQKRKRSH